MVQVDVFWSYGLSSGLALACRKQLKKESKPFDNKYFTTIMLWIAIFFAPSGMYLLWQFPYWETMFVATTHSDIPAWLVALFGVTNITQGLLGYFVTWHFIQAGKDRAASMQAVWSHAAMLFILVVGWDGSGWQRFTYSGTGTQWASGVELPWTGFFTSPVFFALLGLGVFLIPTYTYLVLKWKNEAS